MGWFNVLFVLLLDSSINTQTIRIFFFLQYHSNIIFRLKESIFKLISLFLITKHFAICFCLLPILEVVYIKKVRKSGKDDRYL